MTDPKQLLRKADDLRAALLKQLGYVPEPVLAFCNEVRAALAEEPSAQAREDAERYRFVRESPAMLLHLKNSEFDAAIDKARKEERERCAKVGDEAAYQNQLMPYENVFEEAVLVGARFQAEKLAAVIRALPDHGTQQDMVPADWRETLLDVTNALSELIDDKHPYAKIVAQARAMLAASEGEK